MMAQCVVQAKGSCLQLDTEELACLRNLLLRNHVGLRRRHSHLRYSSCGKARQSIEEVCR